ncbi:hypothetical protein ACO0SA_001178 [Hanseniaspora valbyensis]
MSVPILIISKLTNQEDDLKESHVEESNAEEPHVKDLNDVKIENLEENNENASKEAEPELPQLSSESSLYNDTKDPLYNNDLEEQNNVSDKEEHNSQYESEYENEENPISNTETAATSTTVVTDNVKEDSPLIKSQLDFLIQNQNILQNPEFLNANLNTKIYLISKILSENEELKIANVSFKINQRKKRDYESNQSGDDNDNDTNAVGNDNISNEPNPFDKNISSEELTNLYESYLQEEGKGGREFYPRNSRLFIANLPLNNVTKKILFQIFHIYGKILQINIKNNFGFIQYDSSDSVLDAIKYESKRDNFGRKLVLEISNSTARPQYDHGDHGKNSSSTFVSSYKRYKNGEVVKPRDNYNNGNEKSIHIIVKHQSDRNTANNLFDYLSRNRGWMISMSFLKPQEELKSAIKNAANEQSNGCVIVKNYQHVDAIVFNKNSNGETVFNEYSNADRRDLIRLFSGNTPGYKNINNHQQPPQQQFPGMVTAHIPPMTGYSPAMPGMIPQPPFMQPGQTQTPPAMNLGYTQPIAPPQMQIPQQQQPPISISQDNSRTPQQQNITPVDQNSLLTHVQNLPPDVLKNLLANAQQQQQQKTVSSSNSPQANTVKKDGNSDVLQLLNNLTKK